MSELPISIIKAASNYKEITTDGLTLYPVLVDEYETFLISRPALEILHQALPVRFLRMPLLSALYQMDYEAAASGEAPTGMFSRALLGLALSLRLGEGMEPRERMNIFRVVVDRDAPWKLRSLRFSGEYGEETEITPQQYQGLRQIIAVQNGVKLEGERADPDLVKAERDLAEMNGVSLNASVSDLVSSIAALTGKDEDEILKWPILKLTRRQASLQRLLDYMICGIGQVSGTTWKGGNPHPSPFFDKAENGGLGPHIALSEFAGGAGERAVANAGQQVS